MQRESRELSIQWKVSASLALLRFCFITTTGGLISHCDVLTESAAVFPNQESGSIFLQFSSSTALQLEVIFEVLEEYDWTAFSVVSTRHHGYQEFLSVVEGLTDGSFIGWEKKSVVILNVTDDPGGARTRRLLKENEAQVRQGGGRGERGEERGGSAATISGGPLSYRWLPSFFLPSSSLPMPPHISLSPLSPLSLCSSLPFSSTEA